MQAICVTTNQNFVLLTSDGMHYIVESKGLEDTNVANKDRAARLWCENATQLTRESWAYLKVLQERTNSFNPPNLRICPY
jgi:type III restriction enzyme